MSSSNHDKLHSDALQGFFDVALDLLCIADIEGNFIKVNKAWEDILGYTTRELETRQFLEFVHPDDLEDTMEAIKALAEKQPVLNFTNRYRCKDGSYRYIEWRSHPHGGVIYAAARDITERKKAEDALRENEARSRALVEAIPDILFRFSRSGKCLDVQVKDENLLSDMIRDYDHREKLIGRKVSDIFDYSTAGLILKMIGKAVDSGKLQVLEYMGQGSSQGRYFEARLVSTGNDEVVSIVRDVTDAKHSEARLKYLSLHDSLTGLYNRAYFENELNRLEGGRDYPVAFISADLDGLKLINDTLGHKEGDSFLLACAGVLRESVRSSDVLARVGGDEFALILPNTDQKAGSDLLMRIRSQVEQYNRGHSALPLSISMGLAVSEGPLKPLEEAYQEADRLMYKDKLKRSKMARDEIVRAMLASLFVRDSMSEGFNDQVQGLCIKMGQRAGLSEDQLVNLQLLAQVYDLGKVTIPEAILNKQEKLTEPEWEAVRQHPEKGYRIASASSNLSGIAELILLHHENWDGSGYPLGLTGEDIPIECRILAVVDAYIAMVSSRLYGRNLSKSEAIYELDYCAGRQFDPRLIPLLASVV